MSEVIVIGGSAGALEPLLALVAALPPAFATPIVVVVHLAPGQPSLIPELLARAGRPAAEVDDKQPLERGTIVVAPPNYHVLLERDATLSLSVDEPVLFSRPSIDVLFESAAIAFGRRATGVVLSGANDDGADGLARIAAAGGSAFVQDPASAEHPTMPAAALHRVPHARALSIPDLARHLAGKESPS